MLALSRYIARSSASSTARVTTWTIGSNGLISTASYSNPRHRHLPPCYYSVPPEDWCHYARLSDSIAFVDLARHFLPRTFRESTWTSSRRNSSSRQFTYCPGLPSSGQTVCWCLCLLHRFAEQVPLSFLPPLVPDLLALFHLLSFHLARQSNCFALLLLLLFNFELRKLR